MENINKTIILTPILTKTDEDVIIKQEHINYEPNIKFVRIKNAYSLWITTLY